MEVKRKFPYGCAKQYRQILKEVFHGEATDEQLANASSLIFEIADKEFETHCRRISEDEAMEWIAKAVALVRGDR
jgi:hypothetical protein